jgi:RibD C-terminal domain
MTPARLVLYMSMSLHGFAARSDRVIDWLGKKRAHDDRRFGGATFARSLAHHGLIDEYRITVQPVALGDGLPRLHGLPEPRPSPAAARGAEPVHVRQPSHLPARGLARDVGGSARLRLAAGRVLRSQSGNRRAPCRTTLATQKTERMTSDAGRYRSRTSGVSGIPDLADLARRPQRSLLNRPPEAPATQRGRPRVRERHIA